MNLEDKLTKFTQKEEIMTNNFLKSFVTFFI